MELKISIEQSKPHAVEAKIPLGREKPHAVEAEISLEQNKPHEVKLEISIGQSKPHVGIKKSGGKSIRFIGVRVFIKLSNRFRYWKTHFFQSTIWQFRPQRPILSL